MKQIQIIIADDKIPDSLNVLVDKSKESGYVTKIHTGSRFIITFRATDVKTGEILRELEELKIVSAYDGQIDVLPLEVSLPVLAEKDSDQKTIEFVYKTIAAGNALSADFVFNLICASIIAGAGLAANNPVAVVAAMLVSPLMGPILAFSLAPLVKDTKMGILGLKNELIGILICVLVGAAMGLAFLPFSTHYDWPTAEMTSRGDVYNLVIGVVVATPSGAAVALAVTTGGINSLVGVAISASLLPPAVNAGLMLVYGLIGPIFYDDIDRSEILKISAVSFALVIVNIVCIFVAAALFFKAKEITPLHASSLVYTNVYRINQPETAELYHIEPKAD